jgi:16S rRNA (cytosine967-C5)-methyltransferase
MKSSPRAEAALRVQDWLTRGRSPDLSNLADSSGRGVITEIVFGTIRRYGALKALRAHLANKEPVPAVEAVLLTGLYQLIYLDKKDQHAVVNEGVEAVKAQAGAWAGPFVNAVLRRFSRERESCLDWLRRQPIHVHHSHPAAMIERWRRWWPDSRIERLAEWNNSAPPVVVRVQRTQSSMPAFLLAMKEAGISVTPHLSAPRQFAVLDRGTAVHDLPGYSDGWFVVQDPATAIAVSFLDVRPDHRVLDLCAAPGGKTAALAERMQGSGLLVAVDRRSDRLRLLNDTLSRLRLDNVRVEEADGTDPGAMRELMKRHDIDGFDRILLDAPCTNTGVLRRRVEARWRFSRDRLKKAAQLQKRLLNACTELLAPGGILVYSTCSLEMEENSGMVSGWLKENAEFTLERTRLNIPPHLEMDGAFAARIVRRLTK